MLTVDERIPRPLARRATSWLMLKSGCELPRKGTGKGEGGVPIEGTMPHSRVPRGQGLLQIRAMNFQVMVPRDSSGSSTVNRDHEHDRSTRHCKAREGLPRRLGGIRRGGGT